MLLQEKDNRRCLGAVLDIHMAMLFIYSTFGVSVTG
jgi:hypothetical protein